MTRRSCTTSQPVGVCQVVSTTMRAGNVPAVMGDRSVGGPEPERPGRTVEQGAEHAGRVGTGEAEPFDGSVRRDQAAVLAVGEKGVVGDRGKVAHGLRILARRWQSADGPLHRISAGHGGYRSPVGAAGDPASSSSLGATFGGTSPPVAVHRTDTLSGHPNGRAAARGTCLRCAEVGVRPSSLEREEGEYDPARQGGHRHRRQHRDRQGGGAGAGAEGAVDRHRLRRRPGGHRGARSSRSEASATR